MASRFMTRDKTLWILVNSDFSGTATVGYRLDEKGNPIAEHDQTFQWTLPAHELLGGYIGESETADDRGCVYREPYATLVGMNGYPVSDARHRVPYHVVGRAVALAVAVNAIKHATNAIEKIEEHVLP